MKIRVCFVIYNTSMFNVGIHFITLNDTFMTFFDFLLRIIFMVDYGKLYRRLKGYSSSLTHFIANSKHFQWKFVQNNEIFFLSLYFYLDKNSTLS